MPISLLLLALAATLFSLSPLCLVSAAASPYEVSWAEDSIGPDGPWNAVTVALGTSSSTTLSLFAGATWQSWIIDDNYCSSGTCYASGAGTYDSDKDGSSGDISIKADLASFMSGVELAGDDLGGTRWIDRVDLFGDAVENVSLALISSSDTAIQYPNVTHPLFAGCLAVGGPGATNQSFSLGDGIPTINASLIPGYMWERDWTPSNSFGMHIGAVSPKLSGSLYFGGYDKNRVVGDIITVDADIRGDGITLRDISIDVIGDNSPFEFDGDSEEGLLADSNTTIGSSLKVYVDGCSPYLTLPESTCKNIASHLPIYLDEPLGLYLWNTSSPKYDRIVSSASALSFSFIADSNVDPIKIRVPFMHLNLTLEAPLSDSPKPYFPCHVNNAGKYVLGRAFLQDAFIGANWKVSKWWMAQAPGRNIQAVSSMSSIGEDDVEITKGSNDWKASWDGVWTDEAVEATSTPKANSNGNSTTEEEGMSTGAKAGIAVAVIVGVLGIAGVAGFFRWRRRRNATGAAGSQAQSQQPSEVEDSSFNQKPMLPTAPIEMSATPHDQRFELAS